MVKLLQDAERHEALASLPEWKLSDAGDAIVRSFTFKDFNEAFGFMTQVALHAEKIDHHPEWSNVWRKVDVRLTTHSVHGLSHLDFEMAKFMNAMASASRHDQD
ncbi:MAG: 4a-hydroxytetrahydrobiopterin dehydratase [Nitratireductor sp.]|nr:4a-hydroxytetrahydrobiopterin dehydratase [Nitratireductor sp.]